MFSSFKVLVLIIFCFSFFSQNTFGAVLVSSSNHQSSWQNYEQSSQNLEENQTNLDYQNLDLASNDGVKLRKSESEMGQAYAESGSGSPKYDKVIDIKTCTKKEIYGFFL